MTSGKAQALVRRPLAWLPASLVALTLAAGAAQARGLSPMHPSSEPITPVPETSPWLAVPTSEDVRACIPDQAAPPGRAVSQCRVGGQGFLEKCDLTRIRDARLKSAAACVLPKFRAKALYAGKLVEVPIQFSDEPDGG